MASIFPAQLRSWPAAHLAAGQENHHPRNRSINCYRSLVLKLNSNKQSSSSSAELRFTSSCGVDIMYFELLFASLVVLTTVYMCNMINEGPAANFGYRRFHINDDDYAESTSESEFNAFHLGSPAPSPRSSRWSSTTFSSDDSEGGPEHDLIFTDPPAAESDQTPASSNLSNGEHPTTAESEITEVEVEPLDTLMIETRGAELVEVPWIINPLFQESAS